MNSLNEVTQRVRRIRRLTDRRIAEARLLASNGKKLVEEIELASNDVEMYNKVAIALASIGETRQAAAQQQIEELVTRGLNTIFGNDMSFHVVQTQRGKTPEVKFVIESLVNSKPIETPVMDARGGGLAAVVGFLLRLVVLLLNKDMNDPILILDESFSHVSAEYERPLAEFIKELVDKTRVQLVVVTHSNVFDEFADRRYRFELVNGVTRVKEA